MSTNDSQNTLLIVPVLSVMKSSCLVKLQVVIFFNPYSLVGFPFIVTVCLWQTFLKEVMVLLSSILTGLKGSGADTLTVVYFSRTILLAPYLSCLP